MHCTRALLAVAACVMGCFHEPQNPSLKCDENNPCPDQMACIANLCTAPAPDDMAQADMSDGSSASSAGCAADNGSVVGPGVEACAGACAQGECDKLCGQGWHVCKDAAGIDLALLKALSGFYVADVPGNWFDPVRSQVSCGLATTPAKPVFFGGGKPQANVTDNPARPCSSFTQSADCGTSPLTFVCAAPYDFSHLANTNPNNGVLCCK